MNNVDEKEKERHFEKVDERYTSEREDVPLPDESALTGIEKRIGRPPSTNRPATVTPAEDLDASQAGSQEIFSEALSQFPPMDAHPKNTRFGESEVEGIDQTSPGVEDARGANRVRPKT